MTKDLLIIFLHFWRAFWFGLFGWLAVIAFEAGGIWIGPALFFAFLSIESGIRQVRRAWKGEN